MPSFDIVSEVDSQEIDNAVNSAKRELENRYDFKGSKSSISREKDDIVLVSDDENKLKSVQDILKTYLTRRKIDVQSFEFTPLEKAAQATVKQIVKPKNGIDKETAKKIVKEVKSHKIKVEVSIQGEKLRVSGKKKDDLQNVMDIAKATSNELPLQFNNFRD